MTLALDPPLFHGGLVIAAVTRRKVWHLAAGGNLAAQGQKDAVAVLLHDGQHLQAFRITGGAMTEAEVEHLLPGAAAELAAAWQAAFGDPASA